MNLVLSFSDWPSSDQLMWQALFAEGSPLDDRGPLVHLRVTSRETLAVRYGRWLKWVSATSPTALELPPAQRITTAALKTWLGTLAHVSPMTRLMLVDGVLRILSVAAPERDWTPEFALRARLKTAAGRGTPSRKAGRVLSSAVLLEAGLRLAALSSARTDCPLYRAIGMRDGAMIALLALMPMRRRTLAGLELGSSVFVSEDRIVIATSAELNKTGVPWEAEVPPQALTALRSYLETARPLLAARGDGQDISLWLDRTGERLSSAYIGPRIAERTLEMTGIRVPPHFFRDAAATTLARVSPQSAKLIRPVLGHSGFRTAERHYIHAQTIEAGRDYATLVKKLKEKAR